MLLCETERKRKLGKRLTRESEIHGQRTYVRAGKTRIEAEEHRSEITILNTRLSIRTLQRLWTKTITDRPSDEYRRVSLKDAKHLFSQLMVRQSDEVNR